jgi:glycosyltransferase involved in cell wall biosynthesis
VTRVPSPSAYPVAVFGPFHPHRGGIAHHTTLLAQTLATAHPVLGIGFTRLYPGFLFPGRTQLDASEAPVLPQGVEVRPLVDCIAPHSWVAAVSALRRFRTRLLVVQWWHPFFAPVCATLARGARRGGARVLFLCHNVMPHERSRADTALARLGLGAADGFIVQSAADAEMLATLYPGRPCVHTPHPAYTFFVRGRLGREQARATLNVDGPVVLFFGLVRAYKGLDVLLRAVARARERVPLTLVVAGEFYQERAPYDALVDSLGLRDAVRIHDRYIPNEDVEAYFRAADLVVLPYVSATQSGIAQIALSFERPVLVTRVGGLPEAVRDGETGRVVPPNDPEAMAESLVEFSTTEAAARPAPHRRGEPARFSWDAMAAAVHRAAAALGLPQPAGENASTPGSRRC